MNDRKNSLSGLKHSTTRQSTARRVCTFVFRNAARVGWWGLTIAACSACLIALVWFIAIERASYDQDEAIDDATKKASQLTRVLEEYAMKTLRGADQALAQVAREYDEEGMKLDLHKLATGRAIDAELFRSIGILDESGRLILSSTNPPGLDFSDRDYFQILRDNPQMEVVIGKPVLGKLTGNWVVPIARRINGPKGSFRGIAFGGMDAHYFTRFYRESDLGQNGLVALIGLDGISRVRRTGENDTFGEDMSRTKLIELQVNKPYGDYVTQGKTDGIKRYLSYRRLWDYDMLVCVGVSVDEALAQSREHAAIYRTAALSASVVVLLFAGALMVALWRRQRSQEEVMFKNTLLSTQQETSLDAMLLVDAIGNVLSCNRRFLDMWGIAAHALVGVREEVMFHAIAAQMEEPAEFITKLSHLREHVEEKSNEEIPTLDGRTIDRYSAPVIGARGAYLGRVWYFRDISERRRAEEQSRLSAQAFESIADGIIVTDAQQTIVSVNKAFCEISGYSADEILGRKPKMFRSGRQDKVFFSKMWEVINRDGHWRGEIWDKRKNGEIYPQMLSVSGVRDESGAVTHYVGVCTDISSSKNYEEKLHHQAHHDALTGLPNRLLFQDRFEDALRRAERHRTQSAVMLLDLDRFKHVNDSLGHAAGDLLLKAIAERLCALLRKSDTVARFGGDEFALLLDSVEDTQDAARVARKLLAALSDPIKIGDHEIVVSGSIGISCYPQDGDDAETLFKNADVAMYRAKNEGRDNYRFFSPEMNTRALENLLMSNGLRLALERNEFILHYQPRYEMETGRITSVEALIRWRHPELGLILPGRFIGIAEETGLIQPIGEWVLGEACRQMRAWQDAGLPIERVAVNLSARQFAAPDLLQRIAATLAETRLSAHHLEIEVTESMVMPNPDAAAEVLTRLKDMGVMIAIDDFGTGYSSLSYLKRFPIDFLKIDRSFIKGLGTGEDDGAITIAIIALARSLKLRIVAEGVETEAQHDFLRSHGCDDVQGFLFSKPISAADAERLVQAQLQPERKSASLRIA